MSSTLVSNDTDATTNAVNENAQSAPQSVSPLQASDADATTNGITYSLANDDRWSLYNQQHHGVVTVAGASTAKRWADSKHHRARYLADGSFTDQAFTIAINDVDEFDTVRSRTRTPL